MSFSESSLNKKFVELNGTQQSVQTLSLWIIHHRKHSPIIVKSWLRELLSAKKCERKLTFIYLANDILQNSRRKGTEYMDQFGVGPLAEAIENTAKFSDDKMRFTLERIFNIWKDRKIFPDEKIDQFKKILHSTPSISNLRSPPLTDASKEAGKGEDGKSNREVNAKTSEPDVKKRKSSSPAKDQSNSAENGQKTDSSSKASAAKASTSLKEEVQKELEEKGVLIQVPDATELINLLQDLEKSASSDAIVREKIAELPNKVNDSNEVKNVRDPAEATELAHTVNDAILLIDNYNSRLQQELVSRKQTAIKLAAFIREQRAELEQDEKLVEDWQRKLKQVLSVKNELQIHLESLPDLTTIEVAAELIPLPSAGDLFSSSSHK